MHPTDAKLSPTRSPDVANKPTQHIRSASSSSTHTTLGDARVAPDARHVNTACTIELCNSFFIPLVMPIMLFILPFPSSSPLSVSAEAHGPMLSEPNDAKYLLLSMLELMELRSKA